MTGRGSPPTLRFGPLNTRPRRIHDWDGLVIAGRSGRAGRLLGLWLAFMLLPGCAALFSPLPAAGPNTPPLRIASWNLAFLTPVEGGRCRPASEADYLAAQRLAEDLDADMIAFQQALDERAAQRIFVPGRFIVIMERRRNAQRNSCVDDPAGATGPRATGIAIRRGLPFAVLSDLSELRLGDNRLSSGIDIALRPHGRRPLRLLAIDLVAGCSAGTAGESCPTLSRQAAVIRRWIAQAERLPTRFLIFGGWNRRLLESDDAIGTELDTGGMPSRRLGFAASATTMTCASRLNDLGVHFAFDRRAAGDLRGQVGALPDNRAISAACPVVAEIGL